MLDLVLAIDPENPSIGIDTTAFSDGEHQIGTRPVDCLRNEPYRQFRVQFDNSGPFVNVTSSGITSQAQFTIIGTYKDNGASAITGQGWKSTVLEDGTWSVDVHLENGINMIPVRIEDPLENVREGEFFVSLDFVSADQSTTGYLSSPDACPDPACPRFLVELGALMIVTSTVVPVLTFRSSS